MDRQLNILVVDNEFAFVELARNALESSSYQVVVVPDRKSALDTIRIEIPNLIIVGALEPRGDAFKLHRELRNSLGTHDIPILIIDVRPEEHFQKGWKLMEGMQMDAEDYMSRPVEPDELRTAVRRILERTAWRGHIDSSVVLEQMEEILKRVEKLGKSLVR